jgi:hypothetical protein
MNRREFLRRGERALLATGATLITTQLASAADAAADSAVLEIGAGPQLFLDDYIVESLDGVERTIQPPERMPQPILDSKTFGTTQPYMTVLRDAETKRYRIWYNNQNALWHADSDDGIAWRNPQSLWQMSHCFGASLVDDGPTATDPARRYKLANWQATRAREDKPGDDSGMWVAFSPDGLRWTAYDKNPVLPQWPAGYDKFVPHGAQDIIDVFYDPRHKRYAVALKTPAIAADGLAQAPRAGKSIRRLASISTSKDFLNWEQPRRIFTPDDKTEGLLEFYGMGGIHRRGSLYIGFVRALRDDLPCDPGGPPDGIGYSTLATSRDGLTWNRLREPFLDRNPQPGSWDHAMTWIGYALPVDHELFLYYGGYARGHKVEPLTERQIGLARMKRDRYLALKPTAAEGRIVTRPFNVPTARLTVNTDATKGELRVRLLDVDRKPLSALGEASARPIRTDMLAEEVRWSRSISEIRGKPVRLEFRLKNASLFAFDFRS